MTANVVLLEDNTLCSNKDDSVDVNVNFEQFVKTLSVFLPLKPPHGAQMSREDQQVHIEKRRQEKIKCQLQSRTCNSLTVCSSRFSNL